jgi:hypothetical protein
VLETGKIELELSWLEQLRLCPVWEHQTVRCARLARANWPLSGNHRRRTAIIHRTVRCAPDCPVSQRLQGCQRSASPQKERNRVPDCPVCQTTEGKNCLPRLLSTAPSYLGAIKGTPRRMEKNTKHSLSTLDHSHFILAHLFNILVI